MSELVLEIISSLLPHSYKKFDIFGLVKESHSVYNESLKIYGFTVWKSSYELLLGLNYPGDQNSGFEILGSPLGWCLRTRRSTGGVSKAPYPLESWSTFPVQASCRGHCQPALQAPKGPAAIFYCRQLCKLLA